MDRTGVQKQKSGSKTPKWEMNGKWKMEQPIRPQVGIDCYAVMHM